MNIYENAIYIGDDIFECGACSEEFTYNFCSNNEYNFCPYCGIKLNN